MDIPVNSTFLLPLDEWKYAELHIVGRQTLLCRYRWCVIGITPVLLEVDRYFIDFNEETKIWGCSLAPEHFGIGAIHKLDPLTEAQFEQRLVWVKEDADQRNKREQEREKRRAEREKREEETGEQEHEDIPF